MTRFLCHASGFELSDFSLHRIPFRLFLARADRRAADLTGPRHLRLVVGIQKVRLFSQTSILQCCLFEGTLCVVLLGVPKGTNETHVSGRVPELEKQHVLGAIPGAV